MCFWGSKNDRFWSPNHEIRHVRSHGSLDLGVRSLDLDLRIHGSEGIPHPGEVEITPFGTYFGPLLGPKMRPIWGGSRPDIGPVTPTIPSLPKGA